MQGLCHSCPKLTVLVITKIIFYVSVMVNPPICLSSLVTVVFLMIKYNYCCYPWIFEFTDLQEIQKKNSKTFYNFFIQMPNYSQ